MEQSNKKGKILVYGMREKNRPDGIVINVTSKSKEEWSRKFSPFHLGPVTISPFGEKIECQIMENAWQYSKQYPEHADNDAYLQWATAGFESKKANRFPMGRGKRFLHILKDGKKLEYLEARKELYAPLYAHCVEKYAADSLERIRNMYESGKTVILLDYDGYSKYKNLKETLQNPKRKLGHAFIIAMLVLGERHWEN